ncbi:hypothetical protein BH09BAC5_BH09BAC5_14820 [soil metagenome]
MRKILYLLFLFPSFVIAQRSHPVQQIMNFEENEGQINSKDGTINVQFVLRTKSLTYFFHNKGYSVMQHSPNGDFNRTDFTIGEEVHWEGKDAANSNDNIYRPEGHFKLHCFRKIQFTDVTHQYKLEFSLFQDALVKKIQLANGNLALDFHVDVSGAEVLNSCFRTETVFHSDAGDFSEVLLPCGSELEVHNSITSVEKNASRVNVVMRNSNPNSVTSSVLIWLTYLGGANADEVFGIAVAVDSGVVVTGRTSSFDFPSTPGSFQDTLNFDYDAFVTRFDKDGICLWSTFYGGSNFDGAYQVISSDSVFVISGMTNSNNLPMLNATQQNIAGGYDAFLLVIDTSGQMVRSTYYGGTGTDMGLAIAKGINGEIVLAGSSTSTDLPFASGGFQPTMHGMIDAFLAVFNSSLIVQWSTYYGGSDVEDIHTLTVSPQNKISFAGATRSFNFSVTPNAFQNGLLNQPDNYYVTFDMNGNRLYATYFGGTNTEDVNGIVADENGNVYLTGFTYSADFPTQGTVFQSSILGQNDLFVCRFDSTGQLVWSTFVGGGGQDVAWGMCRLGKYLFICGQTESPTFPVSANAIQATYSANSDGFVIKMDTTGQMISGTYLGGAGFDALLGIAVDADTNVFVCGDTYSTDLPFTTNAYQTINHANGDGYVVKFGMSEELVSTEQQELQHQSVLSVFPNPSSDYIIIESGSNAKILIFDVDGRIVKQIFSENKITQINIADLPAGIYLIEVMADQIIRSSSRFIRK